ncbi:hypothetical protein [Telluria beijingensis]|uniref:hypothetical protein n=1 Tax=Telluria beijingensis TaxID=3068633 RepID=UPI002795C299|nr:hypothetical protein [Massilia sp. REN29]
MTQQSSSPAAHSLDRASTILYHDGCRLCLDIARTLASAMPGLVVVDLGLHPDLACQAAARGVSELPSLVIGAKVLPVAPHSDLAHA